MSALFSSTDIESSFHPTCSWQPNLNWTVPYKSHEHGRRCWLTQGAAACVVAHDFNDPAVFDHVPSNVRDGDSLPRAQHSMLALLRPHHRRPSSCHATSTTEKFPSPHVRPQTWET